MVEAATDFSSFSPVAGIQWVETFDGSARILTAYGFSPVAGIQWVETPSQLCPAVGS